MQKKSLKIIFPVVSLGEAGGEKIIIKIAEGLSQRGHCVEIFVPARTARKILPARNKVKVTEIFPHLPLVSPIIDTISLALSIPKTDVIFATAGLTAPAAVIAGKVLNKGKMFYYIQHYEPLFYKNIKHLLHYFLVKRTYRFFDHFAVDANWINEILMKEIGKKGEVINPGIDLNIFRPGIKGKKSEKKAVIYLGRKGRLRDASTFFQAMKIVCKKVKNLRLINVTNDHWDVSGLCCEYVEEVASGEKLAELYSESDVYVLSSTFEGCPAPPLEAMACGTPVVTTDCLGTRDYAVNGINALVVKSQNPPEMANAIISILTNSLLAETLSEKGVQTAKQFGFESMIDKVERNLLSL